MENIKDIIEEDLKAEYRAGSFLPENYKSKLAVRPQWLENNLTVEHCMAQQQEAEELEIKINEFKSKINL